MSRANSECVDQMELCTTSPDSRDVDPTSISEHQQLRDLREAHDDCGILYFRLTKEHASTKVHLAAARKNNQKLRNDLETLHKTNENLRREKEAKKLEIQKLTDDLHIVSENKAAIESRLNDKRQSETDLEAKWRQCAEQCRQLNEKYKFIKSQQESEKKIKSSLAKSLEEERGKLKELSAELESQKRKNEEADEELQQIKDEYDSYKHCSDSRTDMFKKQADFLSSELKRLTETLGERQADIEKYELLLSTLSSENQLLKYKLHKMKNLTFKSSAETKHGLAQLKADVTQSKTCLKDLAEKCLSKMNEFLSEYREKLESLQSTYKQLMLSSVSLAKKADECGSKCIKLEEEKFALEQNVAHLLNELEEKRKLVDGLNGTVSILESQLEEAKNVAALRPLPPVSVLLTPESSVRDENTRPAKRRFPSSPPPPNDDADDDDDVQKLIDDCKSNVLIVDDRKKRLMHDREYLLGELDYHRRETVKRHIERNRVESEKRQLENENVILRLQVKEHEKSEKNLQKLIDDTKRVMMDEFFAYVQSKKQQAQSTNS